MDQAGIEPATSGSAVRLASVARHITDCNIRPSTRVVNAVIIAKESKAALQVLPGGLAPVETAAPSGTAKMNQTV